MLFSDWKQQCKELLESDKPDMLIDTDKYNLVKPRSRCPHCNHLIRAIDNIPLISYIILKGRCRSCKQPISLRYPFIEIITALTSIIVAWKFGYSWQLLFSLVLVWSLICLSMIDYDHHLLPDDIIMPVLWLGILSNIFGLFTDLYSSILGAMSGYMIFWAIFQCFKFITGKDGMGYGDFKLLALLGAWLGWQILPVIILISSLSATVVGITLIMFGKKERSQPFPFGPYLAIAGIIALIWGNALSFYLFNTAHG